MTIISNIQFSSEMIYDGGKLMTVFLIISLIAALLLTDTKYMDRLKFDIWSNSLILIFIVIVIYRVMLVI